VPDRVTNTQIQMVGFSIGQSRCKHSTAVPRSFELQEGGVFRFIRDSGPTKGIPVAYVTYKKLSFNPSVLLLKKKYCNTLPKNTQ